MTKDELTKDFPKKNLEKEMGKAMSLLRRVYEFCEDNHLDNDKSLLSSYKKILDDLSCRIWDFYIQKLMKTF
jgi:hypothetical protein